VKLPKELTTVTKLSKILALALFILLPFSGFYIGRIYQKSIDQYIYNSTSRNSIVEVAKPLSQPVLINTSSWKEFKDPNGKYSFSFPDNWLISFEKSQYYKDKMDVTVQGPEGKVDFLWAESYGGACQDPGYEKFQIKSGEETICHAANIKGEGVPDNTEFWQLQKQFKQNKPEGIYMNAYSYKNREIFLQIIKSLNIKAG
jgi:hypothetical protein